LTGVDPGSLGVVLAGGGSVGIGWELGVLIALQTEGVSLGAANRIVGTSAGSIVGALLGSGLSMEVAGQRLLNPNSELAVVPPAPELRAEVLGLWTDGPLTQATRVQLGRIALDASTVPLAAWLALIDELIGTQTWPAALAVTAVDAEDGTYRVFDAGSGVPLAAAVAASCTIPGWFPPVPLEGRLWVDGGLRSMSNADLVGRAARIIVLAPFRRDGRSLPQLEAELAPSRAAGARVAIVLPDPAFFDATAGDSMDPRFVAAAGAAGFTDGRRSAAEVRSLIGGASTATTTAGQLG
jgi:NTE family protein